MENRFLFVKSSCFIGFSLFLLVFQRRCALSFPVPPDVRRGVRRICNPPFRRMFGAGFGGFAIRRI